MRSDSQHDALAGAGTEFLIYAADDHSILDFIPIAIVGGRVTGIGRHVYDHVVRAKVQADLRPDEEPARAPPLKNPN